MADRRRRRPPCIPGLVPQAFVKGSRHSAPCPVLKSSEVEEEDGAGQCHFVWEAKGSSGGSYEIKATGKLEMELDKHDKPVGRGLQVTCSCPDGERQAAASLTQNKIVVCKHGAAALESVLDEEAAERHGDDMLLLRQERATEAERRRQEEERAAQEQERVMPGERARIEYGLSGALSDQEIKKCLNDACKSVEGLRALAVVFPESCVPVPQTKYCVRCKEHYDERFQEQKVCRMEHPYEHCSTEWDGSKISWQHCYRCDGDFGVPDSYQRRRNAPYDVGEWCFQGEHTQDESLVEKENWDADPSDLVY